MRGGGHGPWDRRARSADDRRAFADAAPVPFWLDTRDRPPARPPLAASLDCDLAIVGGGLSGLWAALLAVERHPDRTVVLLERDRIATAASGRNGGFLSSFLTHGVANGMARFPEEMPVLERLGLENFAAIRETIDRLDIDCEYEATGELDVAVQPHEVEWLVEEADAMRRLGHDVDVLDRDAIRAEVHSPIYEGALWRRSGSALVHPAKLCWGLAREAERAGARIFEGTAVQWVRSGGDGVLLATDAGAVRARQVLLATSAFPGLLGEIRRRVVPVWDYVLVTEPLDAGQREAIGWQNRQGIGDMGNRFHYYRQTADHRILWGGYDAIYGYGNALNTGREQRERTFADLVEPLLHRVPAARGDPLQPPLGWRDRHVQPLLRLPGHRSRRPRRLHGRPHRARRRGEPVRGRGGARPPRGARDRGDRACGRCGRSRSRSRPSPCAGRAIELTRNRLAAADRNGGRRGLWLRALDRFGLGYDS